MARALACSPSFSTRAKLILIWGSNPIASNLHFWTRAQEAKRRGARLIAIDPYRSLTAEKCHQHIALKPGTDGALALGMMNVLITENLLDHEYIEAHTLGFDEAEGPRAQLIRRRVLPKFAASMSTLSSILRDFTAARKRLRSA